MEYDNELSELKRQQLEQRKRSRDDTHDSILEHFGGEQEESIVSRCEDAVVTIDDKPAPCPACNGKGFVKSLFSNWECGTCYGTTYDLSNPVAVIKWQKLCMEWAKKDVMQTRIALREAVTTAEERMAESVENFYANAARKD